jgi:hypothetical protein
MRIRYIFKILFFLWIALAGLPLLQASAKVTSLPGEMDSQNQKLNTLFQLSGIEDYLGNVESILEISGNINEDALAPGQGEFAKGIMRFAYPQENFYRMQRESFFENYQSQHIQSVIQWYRSSLGEKITRLEGESYNPDSKPALELFVKNLLNAPPSEERMFLIEEIERSSGMTDAGITLYLEYVKLMYPFNKNIQGKRLGKMLRMWKESITEPLRETVLRGLLFSYKDLKDKELDKYVEFLSSKAGRWFSQASLEGFKYGVKKNLHQAKKVQEELVKEIESGGPEFPLLKEIAAPGQRYLLIGMRDPFLPLVDEKGLISLSELSPKTKTRLLGDELKNIPPIALQVINKIEDKYPSLFKSLQRYERLINNRETLEEMDDEEYTETIANYRDVLERAADIKMDESPLQIAYDALRMTGIIQKKLETVAMFEIGSTGYAVRLGDRVGPVFGYVDEIQSEQVIVVEKFRNYLGHTLTNQQVIEFYQGPSNEGDSNL